MNTVLFKSTKERINGGLFTVLAAMTLLVSCKKNIHEEMGSRNHASAYSSEVLGKWMTMQLRLIKNATGITNHGFSRPIAYTGIAALESMSPGLNGTDKKWGRQWNGLTAIPVASNGYHYYYTANVNGAMATINRLFFS